MPVLYHEIHYSSGLHFLTNNSRCVLMYHTVPITFTLSAGIGNAIAKALATSGAGTVALSRTQGPLDKLQIEVCVSM